MRTVEPRGRRAVSALCLLLGLSFGAFHRVSGEPLEVLRIYLARHGQTDWNLEHRLQGGTDIALNALGRRQAAQLAERMRGIRLDAVYASPLRRSRETAEIVHGSVPVTIVAGLAERRLGKFEGRRTDESDPGTAQEYERRSQEPDDSLDGGESVNQFFERVRAAIAGIVSRNPSGTILIVGHGVTNQMIVRALLGLSAPQARSFQQANDELYLIDVERGRPSRLWKLIDLGH
jgi:broad specificity phosphatase PhoE